MGFITGRLWMLPDKIRNETGHDVRKVFSLLKFFPLPVLLIIRKLGAGIDSASTEAQVLVEAPFSRAVWNLSPLANACGQITGLFHDRRQHDLAVTGEKSLAVVAIESRPEGVATGQHLTAGRPAKRCRVGVFKAGACLRELVDVGGLVGSAVTANIADPDIIRENQDDIRFLLDLRFRSASG